MIILVVNDITICGGIERVVINLAELFYSKKKKVKIISLFKTNDSVAYKLNSNIQIIYLNNFSYNINKIQKIIYKVINFFKLKKVVSNLETKDIKIIGTDYFLNIYLTLLFDKRIYKIGSEHAQYYSPCPLIIKIRKFFYNKLDKLIVLTKHDFELFKLEINDSKKIKIIKNYVENLSKEKSKLEEKKILMVGRLEEEKGYDRGIKVLKEVLKKYPDWKIEIYGVGSQKNKILELIKKMNLNDNIILKGVENNKDIIYSKASIFFMSSIQEALPMVLIEAKSYGIPIIAFDCPVGPREIIKNNYDGFLIEDKNLEEAVFKIETLIQDSKLRKLFGENTLKNLDEYSKENIWKFWKEIL